VQAGPIDLPCRCCLYHVTVFLVGVLYVNHRDVSDGALVHIFCVQNVVMQVVPRIVSSFMPKGFVIIRLLFCGPAVYLPLYLFTVLLLFL